MNSVAFFTVLMLWTGLSFAKSFDFQNSTVPDQLHAICQKYQKHQVTILFKIEESEFNLLAEKSPKYTHIPQISERQADVIVSLTLNRSSIYSGNKEAEYFVDIQYNTKNLFPFHHPEQVSFQALIARAEQNVFGVSRTDLDKPLRVKTATVQEFQELITPHENQGSNLSLFDQLFTTTWSLKSLYEQSKSTFNQLKIPAHVWNQQDFADDYRDFWGDSDKAFWRDISCGATDASLNELTGLVHLATFLVDLTTDAQFRGELMDAITNIEFSDLQKAFVNKLDKLSDEKTQYYESSFTATEVALILVGIGGAKKITKIIRTLADPKKAKFAQQMDEVLKGVSDKSLRQNARKSMQEIPRATLEKLKNYPAKFQERFLKDWLANPNFQKAFQENPRLFISWKRLTNSPLRTNLKYLEAISDFPKSWRIEFDGNMTILRNSQDKALAELSENTIKAKAGNGTPWNSFLNKPLMKNHRYQIDRYTYETDELGRVKKVKGKLERKMRGRNGHQQQQSVKLKDGVKGQDNGGHLIANMLNGPGEQINYVPMKSVLNQRAWKSMELRWAKVLKEGKNVEVEIRPVFKGTSKRPVGFEVDYWINGKANNELFRN